MWTSKAEKSLTLNLVWSEEETWPSAPARADPARPRTCSQAVCHVPDPQCTNKLFSWQHQLTTAALSASLRCNIPPGFSLHSQVVEQGWAMKGTQLPVELRLNPTKTNLPSLHVLQESRQHPCGREGPLDDPQLCLAPVWEGYACSKENLLNPRVCSFHSRLQSQGSNSLFCIGK